MNTDLSNYNAELTQALLPWCPEDHIPESRLEYAVDFADDLLASPVIGRIIADARTAERERIATEVEALHYDAPAARTAQATAARIARGGAQ